jgi:hypothetical protein
MRRKKERKKERKRKQSSSSSVVHENVNRKMNDEKTPVTLFRAFGVSFRRSHPNKRGQNLQILLITFICHHHFRQGLDNPT